MKLVRTCTMYIGIALLLLGCSLKTTSTIPEEGVLERPWNQYTFDSLYLWWDSLYDLYTHNSETFAFSDSQMMSLEDLILLSLDGRNPTPDYKKAYELIELMPKLGGDVSNELHSWNLLLSQVNSLKNENDSIKTSVSSDQGEIEKLRSSNKELSSKNAALNYEVRLLRDSVASQVEVIEKLKKLELLMEQERKRFQ